MIDILSCHGVDADQSANLFCPCIRGKEQSVIKLLIERGANPCLKSSACARKLLATSYDIDVIRIILQGMYFPREIFR